MTVLFVAGTDTDVGKTFASCALVTALRRSGVRVAVMKPISAGCAQTPDGLRNDDALALIEASGLDLDYDTVNPYAFEPAIAPHIAALDSRVTVDRGVIMQSLERLEASADLVVVEGAGGWAVPLGHDFTYGDLVADAGWPVLLVVGMRLGCLNHALLSAAAIAESTRLVGWVANHLPPGQDRFDDNLSTLFARMPAPLWAALPVTESAGESAGYTSVSTLFDITFQDGMVAPAAFAPSTVIA